MNASLKRGLALWALIAVVATGCAGDLGAESGLPACNARPRDPAGYVPVETEEIEGSDRSGGRYAYRGPDGEQVTFYYGVTTDAGGGLPKVQLLPLAGTGGGQLLGQGTNWTFTWTAEFPCDRMRIVGSGFTKKGFIRMLGGAHVIPAEEEEGGAAPGIVEGEAELEGEIEGALPPGGPAIEWVAIFETAREPEDLARIEQRLMKVAARNLVVLPASCWKGLAQQLGVPREAHVAGLVALTANELTFVIERVGLPTLFSGQLRSRCD